MKNIIKRLFALWFLIAFIPGMVLMALGSLLILNSGAVRWQAAFDTVPLAWKYVLHGRVE